MTRSDRTLELMRLSDEEELSPRVDALLKDMYQSIESVYYIAFRMLELDTMGHIADLFTDSMEIGVTAAGALRKGKTNGPNAVIAKEEQQK